VDANSAEDVVSATRELLERMVEANGIDAVDVASAIFTATADLTAAFPARAAREMGWERVPLLDAVEMAVPGSLPRCIRVLIHWNTERSQAEVRHVYLRGAAALRPDLGGELHGDARRSTEVHEEGRDEHREN